MINQDDNSNSLSSTNLLQTPTEVEAKFQECLQYLNVAFNPSNIFFKYKGYRIVQNSTFSSGNGWHITIFPYSYPVGFEYAANDLAQYKKVDMMNLIFSDVFTDEVNPAEIGFWI